MDLFNFATTNTLYYKRSAQYSLLNCWNAPLMRVVGVEIIMLGPLPGIKYWTEDELQAPAFPASPALLLFSGVVVGVSVALLFTLAFVVAIEEVVVAVVGYTFPPFRMRYCWSSDIGNRAANWNGHR